VVIKSNMGLYVSVYVSFNCNLSFVSLCMWNCSSVFMSGPFFSHLDVVLLVCMACICSLYRVLKFLPVWPTYFRWQLLHFISYMPLWLYLSGSMFFTCRCFCKVLFVL
jgi:hypothetical protein